MDTTPAAPADWYPNPSGVGLRYWDGLRWTDYYCNPAVSNEVTTHPPTESEPPATIAKRAPLATSASDAEPNIVDMVKALGLRPADLPLDEQVEVAGETYHVKGIKKVFRELGRPITDAGCNLEGIQVILVPEPWNPHDSNAVAIMVGVHHVGYIPADLACDYAAPLGRLAGDGLLATGVARIWAKSDGGVVRARVTLLIPEAELL